jgi:hypothetical protein
MTLLSLLLSCLLRPPATVVGFARISGSLGRTTFVTTTTAAAASGGYYSSSSSPSSLSMSRNKPSNTFNPFRMVGDMASNVFGSSSVSSNPNVETAVTAIVQDITWDTIRQQLEQQMESEDERQFRKNLFKGYGIGSPLHKIRLFDESNKEEDIRVVFYRDSAR